MKVVAALNDALTCWVALVVRLATGARTSVPSWRALAMNELDPLNVVTACCTADDCQTELAAMLIVPPIPENPLNVAVAALVKAVPTICTDLLVNELAALKTAVETAVADAESELDGLNDVTTFCTTLDCHAALAAIVIVPETDPPAFSTIDATELNAVPTICTALLVNELAALNAVDDSCTALVVKVLAPLILTLEPCVADSVKLAELGKLTLDSCVAIVL